MMNKIRVAVLGYGHLGKWHCQKVVAHSDRVEFVAIVEKFPAGQIQAKTNHPGLRVVSDVSEIMGEIDAAFVVTPTSVHFELVKLLLENDKHVFCEKPLCSNDHEALALKKIALDKKVVLQVGHSERFHEAWERLVPRLHSLKTPYTVRINRVAPFKGRATDVDVVQDLAIHDLDLLMYLFKQKPKKIKASGIKIRTNKWDHATIQVEMEEGCEAIIVVGRNHVKEMRDIEVISQDGMIFVDLFMNKILEAPKGEVSEGVFVKEDTYPKRDHLMLEHRHFYDSIQNGLKSVVGLYDGLAAVHLIDCTLESMDRHEAVIVKWT